MARNGSSGNKTNTKCNHKKGSKNAFFVLYLKQWLSERERESSKSDCGHNMRLYSRMFNAE